MCGIVGYKGKRNVKDVLVEGLSTLEYRGYDSAGIAVLDNNKVRIVKSIWLFVVYSLSILFNSFIFP